MTLKGTLSVAASTDAATFSFTVTNADSQPIDLHFSDACKAEFVVLADEDEVWRYTEGRLFAQALDKERLAPGGTSTYEATWTDPRPGAYTAVAESRAQNLACEARAAFTVPA